MKKIILFIIFLLFTTNLAAQEWIDDSNFQDIINEQGGFDDSQDIIIIEFWAEFNQDNSFSDWKQIDDMDGVKYYRVDIAKAPSAKKEYRVRMAPTIIIFKEGTKEKAFKAGLDLECPVGLSELKDAINVVIEESAF